MKRFVAFAALALAPLAFGQELKLAVLDKLKPLASNAVDINLSKDLLNMGAGFLGDGGDKVKKLVQGLNTVAVRSFEFKSEGIYSHADVQQIISEMNSPGWKLVISSDEKEGREISRIWLKSFGEGEIGGLRVVSAEPKELSVIEITGKIRLEDLKDLGALGIPNIMSEHTGKPAKNEE